MLLLCNAIRVLESAYRKVFLLPGIPSEYLCSQFQCRLVNLGCYNNSKVKYMFFKSFKCLIILCGVDVPRKVSVSLVTFKPRRLLRN